MMNKQEQSQIDRAIIQVKLIENGVMVGSAGRWFSYKTWDEAAKVIETRLAALMRQRTTEAQ